MNIELYMLDKLKARVQLARQIDVAQHKVKKEKHEKNWLKETADAMGIELDSDFVDRCARPHPVCLPVFEPRRPPSDGETKSTGPTKHRQKATDTRIKDQKQQLKQHLMQPLLAQGVSKRYVTSGNNPIAHELLAGESKSAICRCGDRSCAEWKFSQLRIGHGIMLGVKKTSARSDLSRGKAKRRSKKEYEHEEWSGFGSTL